MMLRRLLINWRMRRWTSIGERLFCCDRDVMVRLLACVVRHAITIDEIVAIAERAAEAADKGYHV